MLFDMREGTIHFFFFVGQFTSYYYLPVVHCVLVRTKKKWRGKSCLFCEPHRPAPCLPSSDQRITTATPFHTTQVLAHGSAMDAKLRGLAVQLACHAAPPGVRRRACSLLLGLLYFLSQETCLKFSALWFSSCFLRFSFVILAGENKIGKKGKRTTSVQFSFVVCRFSRRV